jgi:hypothetical protein
MDDRAHRVDLWCVVDRLRANPNFMAGWCAARLMLCKLPRPDQRDHDLAAFAGAVGVDLERLAAAMTQAALVGSLLRAVDTLHRW